MNEEIVAYNEKQEPEDQEICNALALIIDQELTDAVSKIWHGHPVWFLDRNPVVGYSKQKMGLRLMFWSGADFEEGALNIIGKKFRDASIFYKSASDIDESKLREWLQKAKAIQWDYQNIVKRKGKLERLK